MMSMAMALTRRCPPLFPELDRHSARHKLKQGFFGIPAHVQDNAVFIPHGYTAHATRQGKSGLAGQVGSFKLGDICQIVNFSDGARFGYPNINES